MLEKNAGRVLERTSWGVHNHDRHRVFIGGLYLAK